MSEPTDKIKHLLHLRRFDGFGDIVVIVEEALDFSHLMIIYDNKASVVGE